MYSHHDLIRYRDFYKNQLLNNTVPFWFPRSVDEEHGGFLFMRDADGSLIDDDKAVWIPVSYTHLDVYKRQAEYLKMKKSEKKN